jgi:hypothetical protein
MAAGPWVMVTPSHAPVKMSHDALVGSHVMVHVSAAASDDVPVCAKYVEGWI